MEKNKINRLLIELLMKCHEKEILQQEPCNPSETKEHKSLLQEGLVEIRDYIGEKGLVKKGFYITAKGTTAINEYIMSRQM